MSHYVGLVSTLAKETLLEFARSCAPKQLPLGMALGKSNTSIYRFATSDLGSGSNDCGTVWVRVKTT